MEADEWGGWPLLPMANQIPQLIISTYIAPNNKLSQYCQLILTMVLDGKIGLFIMYTFPIKLQSTICLQ